MCNRSIVEFVHPIGRVALEGDSAAVGKGRWLVVDRLADTEGAAVVSVEEPSVTCVRLVTQRFAYAERSKHRIVEMF